MPPEPHVLHVPDGLLGFPEAKHFHLLEPGEGHLLKLLQEVNDPSLVFVCLEASAVRADYGDLLDDALAASLDLQPQDECIILLQVTVPEDPRQMTANLAAPLVFNTRTLAGRQVALDPKVYPPQPVFTPRTDTIVDFQDGLVGFPGLRAFRLFEPQGSYPLKFLQSVEAEDVSFTCIDVGAIKPDYQIPLSKDDADRLALERPQEALILAMVVIPDDPRQMTANLAGPLIINTRTLRARQVILNTDVFPLKYPILAER